MDDLQRELWEYADGRPASPALQRALDESPELRAELERARKRFGGLRASLAGFKLDERRAASIQAQIAAELPGRVFSIWRVGAAAAAALALALAGMYVFWPRDAMRNDSAISANTESPREAVHQRQWNVERFSPHSVGFQEDVLRREESLVSGEAVAVGPQEYARISEPATGAMWLALPGTLLVANGSLKLERGALEVLGSRKASGEVVAAGRTLRSHSNFFVAVEGGATLVSVYAGEVSETDSSGERLLKPGRHETGESRNFTGLDARAAYVKGFEAWRISDWKAARAQFKIAAESTDLETQSRCNAYFYWFAAAGNEGDRAAAVVIGENYIASYPQDSSLDYVRYFLGEYLLALGQSEKGVAYLKVVAKGPAGTLRELAQSKLAEVDGGGETKPAALWQAFYQCWQRHDYAGGEDVLRRLIDNYPSDASVQSGEAAFRLFACVGNQDRFADAITLAGELLTKYPEFSACDYALYFKAYYESRLSKNDEALLTLKQLDSKYPASPMWSYGDSLRKELQPRK